MFRLWWKQLWVSAAVIVAVYLGLFLVTVLLIPDNLDAYEIAWFAGYELGVSFAHATIMWVGVQAIVALCCVVVTGVRDAIK